MKKHEILCSICNDKIASKRCVACNSPCCDNCLPYCQGWDNLNGISRNFWQYPINGVTH